MKKKNTIYNESNKKKNEYILLNDFKQAINVKQLMCL